MDDAVTTFYFARPWMLPAAVVLVPVLWLAVGRLGSLGRIRRYAAVGLRVVSILLLVSVLAQLTMVRTNRQMTVIAVLDRSLSIPAAAGQGMLDYLKKALEKKPEKDLLAVVDVAEAASISRLAGPGREIHERNTTLQGEQSRLADGIGMAMAIAPPNTAVRILLSSDGNETEGDLKKAAQLAAMNGIPVDVLPLRYDYPNEVVFKSLVAPASARSGQTISPRFILQSAQAVRGKLFLTMNGKPVDLDPESSETAAVIELQAGVNVKSISLPLGMRGLHEFDAVFVPDHSEQDQISQNNRTSGLTYVVGPGQVLVVDSEGNARPQITKLLQDSQITASAIPASEFPGDLARLVDVDAIVLADTECGAFSLDQQKMLCRFVNDLGGGLVMVGGTHGFGAGGWIGSPVADILPVDLDPPQKKEMPKGALVLVIDRSGSMSGEKLRMSRVAAAATVRLLSRQDMVGVVMFDGASHWVIPLKPADDKDGIIAQIGSIIEGGGTTMGPAMEDAFDALKSAKAAVKHMILLTDGMTSDRDFCVSMGETIAGSNITVSTVAVGPDADEKLLFDIAQGAKGRYYRVVDPVDIPKIFVKEAQVIKRTMIVEKTFVPQITFGLSDTIKGLSAPLPSLDGYILTGPRQGLSQTVLSSPDNDPILATCQSGLGRCTALTTSADSRWASQWLAWGGYGRFWEQLVRWTARPAQPTDCDVAVDVSGHEITVYVDALASGGGTAQWSQMDAQIIGPDMKVIPMPLTQTGPGQFEGHAQAELSGSYLMNLRYQKAGTGQAVQLRQTPIMVPFAPEFKDMKDNASLLHEISTMTGGRILPSDPQAANLFDPTGLKFPRTETPLTELLMFIWLGVFLLDVAVRRVVMDAAAIGRKMAGWFRRSNKATRSDDTVARLKERQKAIHAQLTQVSREEMQKKASVKYEPPKEMSASALPVELPAEQKPSAAPKPEPAAPAEKPAEKTEYIDMLLKARKKARSQDKHE